jgi:hypothetical protein
MWNENNFYRVQEVGYTSEKCQIYPRIILNKASNLNQRITSYNKFHHRTNLIALFFGKFVFKRKEICVFWGSSHTISSSEWEWGFVQQILS